MNLKDLNLDEFICIDVETTGLDINSDKIIEIAAVKFKNGEIIESFTRLINPAKKIPYFITNLTGIKNSDIEEKPSFQEVGKEFIEFIGKYPIIGHNVLFDINFINKELKGIYNLYDNEVICDTYQLSRIFLYDLNSFKLQSLCSYFSININDAHRAEDDAIITGFLFLELIKFISKSSLDDFNKLLKIYSTTMIINYKLFKNCMKYLINNSMIRSNSSLDRKIKNNIYINKSKDELNLNLENIFSKEGLLSKVNSKYDFRPSQYEFSLEVEKTMRAESILVAEAETGLGKTYGYLIPPLINSNIKTIVSTSTHNLQEQIFNNDIPFIAKGLDVSVKAVIVKGMNNYLCNARLSHLVDNIDILNDSDRFDLCSLVVWSYSTETGDISECNGFKTWRSKKIWDLVCYNYEFCSSGKVDKHEGCFYKNLKRNIDDATLLVINHALLASCYQKQESIISDKDICIIDEAHNFAENCRSHLKESLNNQYFEGLFDSYKYLSLKILKQNINDEHYEVLSKKIDILFNEFSLFLKLFEDMSFSFAQLKLENAKIFNNIQDYRYKCFDKELISLDPSLEVIDIKYNKVVGLLSDVNNSINKAGLNLYSKSDKTDLTILSNRILDTSSTIKKIFSDSTIIVNWISIRSYSNRIQSVTFNSAPLNVDDIFLDLSSQFNSMVLTSATLTVNYNFDYMYQEIGLNNYLLEKGVVNKRFLSPFFIKDQIKLFINDTYEDINSLEFIESTFNLILDLKDKISKRTLVLCTSYKQITDFKNINKSKGNIFFQETTSSKQILLDNYLKHTDSILFGTSSFWEGVDLPNDKLEILVILKVPFSNPYNPIVQAKIDTYIKNKMDPFIDYQLADAILKLKQGIGRLIRQKDDLGICILADPRILKKRYGDIILDSLPVDHITYKYSSTILHETENFLGI